MEQFVILASAKIKIYAETFLYYMIDKLNKFVKLQ